jgi:CRP-like cAMP-binding protein
MTTLDLLTDHPFLAGMPPSRIARLSSCARPVHRSVAQRLFSEGRPAEHFWLLLSGRVALDFRVAGRGDVVIERIDGASVIGWSWLFPPYRWHFGAVVAETVQAVVFDAADVRRLISEDVELAHDLDQRFMAVMVERLQAARRRLVQLYDYPAA